MARDDAVETAEETSNLEVRVTQLTDNELQDESYQISGDNVVWVGRSGTHRDGNEIFLYDGNTIRQLTDDANPDYDPQISGDRVVWWTYSRNTSHAKVYLFDSDTLWQSGGGDDRYAQVSGTNVAWLGNGGQQVVLYDGTSTVQLSEFISNYGVRVSGSNTFWMNDLGDGNCDIFWYDGNTVTKIAEGISFARRLEASGSSAVWYGSDGNDDEIFLYDETLIQLTDNDSDDALPQISGANVVWQGIGGGDREIFLYDGNTTRQLTDNTFDDIHAQISGSRVVWQGFDGHDWEIYLYDGNSIHQVTDNTYNDVDPEISGSNIVWKAYDGHDWELFQGAITVNPLNDAPVVTNDAYSTNEDNPLLVEAAGLLANDSDVDGDTLWVVLVDGPSHGTLTLESDGSFVYTPDTDYFGTDSFTYQANDGDLDSNVATVTITVARDLGGIHVVELPHLNPAADDTWYAFRTTRDALITLWAQNSGEVTITLYDENLNELADWTPGNGNERIEWPAEEGQNFYFHLSGTDDDVNVHLANVIKRDDGFLLRAKLFDFVHRDARQGGTKVADPHDSKGNDKFVADPEYGELFSDGLFNRAKFFERR